jgi:hypothetical protein
VVLVPNFALFKVVLMILNLLHFRRNSLLNFTKNPAGFFIGIVLSQ